MKTLRMFSAFALCSFLFISCNQQGNAGAVYYQNNTMLEKIVITSAQQSNSNNFTSKNVNLRLSSSPFFNEHRDHLEIIDILEVSYAVSDTSVDLSSAMVKIGDMVLPNFDGSSNGVVRISDVAIMDAIRLKLEEDRQITFSFENNFGAPTDLEIDVTVKVKGTFVH